jgi:hypothetical protein
MSIMGEVIWSIYMFFFKGFLIDFKLYLMVDWRKPGDSLEAWSHVLLLFSKIPDWLILAISIS